MGQIMIGLQYPSCRSVLILLLSGLDFIMMLASKVVMFVRSNTTYGANRPSYLSMTGQLMIGLELRCQSVVILLLLGHNFFRENKRNSSAIFRGRSFGTRVGKVEVEVS